MAANEAAIEMRRAAKKLEVQEVEAILAYQAMKVPLDRRVVVYCIVRESGLPSQLAVYQ